MSRSSTFLFLPVYVPMTAQLPRRQHLRQRPLGTGFYPILSPVQKSAAVVDEHQRRFFWEPSLPHVTLGHPSRSASPMGASEMRHFLGGGDTAGLRETFRALLIHGVDYGKKPNLSFLVSVSNGVVRLSAECVWSRFGVSWCGQLAASAWCTMRRVLVRALPLDLECLLWNI